MDAELRELERRAVRGDGEAAEAVRRWRGRALLSGPHRDRYRVILADPPWKFANYGQAKHGAARAHYRGLTPDELAMMPVRELAAPDAVCLLWCTRPHSAEGRHAEVLRAWGFRPVTRAFLWVKHYRSGAPYCGLGHYTRAATEDCWLGVRGGGMTPAPRDVLEVVDAPVGRHSAKPPEVYELIGRMWPKPEHASDRLELFCRGTPAAGWVGWGNECEGGADVFGAEVGSSWPMVDLSTGPDDGMELFA